MTEEQQRQAQVLHAYRVYREQKMKRWKTHGFEEPRYKRMAVLRLCVGCLVGWWSDCLYVRHTTGGVAAIRCVTIRGG